MFQTEFEFTLPCGYLDEDGTLHRDGVMRRATAADEILPLQGSARAEEPGLPDRDPALARRHAARRRWPAINPKVIEGLFAADLAYLQDALQPDQPLHDDRGDAVRTAPGTVEHGSSPRRSSAGGVVGYPLDQLHEEVAFVAYHFHWPHERDHGPGARDRRRWVARDLGASTSGERNERVNR